MKGIKHNVLMPSCIREKQILLLKQVRMVQLQLPPIWQVGVLILNLLIKLKKAGGLGNNWYRKTRIQKG